MKIFSNIVFLTIVLSAFGCNTRKAAEKSKEPGSPVSEETAPPPSDNAPKDAPVKPVFEGPGEKLAKRVGEWSIKGAPRYFGPDNLYDLINGGAEVYTAYGLKKMVTADYTSEKTKEVTITAEIYDMGSALGAFGRFSKFLENKAEPATAGEGLPVTIKAQGLFGGANASFWKGSYLVNLTLLEESSTATMESAKALGEKHLPGIAEAIFKTIISDERLPEIFGRFPQENLVKRSELYIPDALLGMDTLGPGFSARYKTDKAEWILFVTSIKTEENSAEAALQSAQASGGIKGGIVLTKEGKRVIGYKTTSDGSDKKAAAHLGRLAQNLAK